MLKTLATDTDLVSIALASFAGGLGGAVVVALATLWVPFRTRLRTARAEIYLGSLDEIGNRVNDICVAAERDNEPKGQPPELGALYSRLVMEATVASKKDRERVLPWHATWNAIGEIQGNFSKEMERTEGEPRRALGAKYAADQVPAWRSLDASIRDYKTWLESHL